MSKILDVSTEPRIKYGRSWKDKQTQMELGWSCDENDRKPLNNPHYVLDAPATQKKPRKIKNEMEGRLG